MPKTYDVAGIGNAIVDVIAPVDDGFLLTHQIAKGVMTLIDEFRAEQLFSAFPQSREIAGGSAANTMVGVASFGGSGLFVGKVKDDRLGQSFAASLTDTGIRYTTHFAKSGPATACCLIAVTPEGQRSMNTYLGASRELKPADIDEDAIGQAQVLYIEGYQWDAPESKAAITKAMVATKKAGGKVALTLSDPFCVGRNREEFLDLYKTHVDVLFANEDEATALFEVDAFDDALQAVKAWKGNGSADARRQRLRGRARQRCACDRCGPGATGGGYDGRGRSIRRGLPLWAYTRAASRRLRQARRHRGR